MKKILLKTAAVAMSAVCLAGCSQTPATEAVTSETEAETTATTTEASVEETESSTTESEE